MMSRITSPKHPVTTPIITAIKKRVGINPSTIQGTQDAKETQTERVTDGDNENESFVLAVFDLAEYGYRYDGKNKDDHSIRSVADPEQRVR